MTPMLCIFFPISSTADCPGGLNKDLLKLGWKGFIAECLTTGSQKNKRPYLPWANEAKVKVEVMAHLCFGQYDTDMRLDAYDAAVAGDMDKVTHRFAESWKEITVDYDVIGYSGDLDQMPWLEWDRVRSMIQRNLRPYASAGFQRVCIDAAGDAINHPAVIDGVGEFPRSRNGVLLSAADAMFKRPSLIEATPRNFPEWAHLHARDVVIQEANWRRRHSDKPGEMSGNALVKGYGPRGYLTGRIYRIVDTLEEAQRVAAEGDVPCVKPWKLGGVKASEIFATPISQSQEPDKSP